MTSHDQTLEAALLGIVGNDYESLETIRKHHWDADVPLPPVDEMIRCLRALHDKGLVDCYRFAKDESRFVPIERFEDEEALDPVHLTGRATLWWLATESGRSAAR